MCYVAVLVSGFKSFGFVYIYILIYICIYIYESLWHGERESSWELQGLLTVQFPRGIEGN